MVLIYFNVLEDIVKKSLITVSSTTESVAQASPIVVGGIGIQLHCFKDRDLLRSTSDLDLLYLPRIASVKDFQEGIGGKVISKIRSFGYQAQPKKSRSNYEVKVMKGQGQQAKELFFIHFDCLSDELYEKTRYISEREVDNAIESEIPELGRLFIKRIKNILPHKVKRIRKKLNEGGIVDPLSQSLYRNAEQMKWSSLASYATPMWCMEIAGLQNRFPSDEKSHSPVYDVNKDLYDVCLLARKIESEPDCFNRSYYLNARSQIEQI